MLMAHALSQGTAMNLIEGFEIVEFQGGFNLKFLTVVPFFNVTETYRCGPLPAASPLVQITSPHSHMSASCPGKDASAEEGCTSGSTM